MLYVKMDYIEGGLINKCRFKIITNSDLILTLSLKIINNSRIF